MIRLPAFLNALAGLVGRRAETLEEHAVRLRAAGLLPPTKRGRGAVTISQQAAVSLLLAGMATESPAAAPRLVEVFRGLRTKRLMADRHDVLGTLAKVDNFGEALELLFLIAPTFQAALAETMRKSFPDSTPEELEGLRLVEIEVSISQPVPHARIEITERGELGQIKQVFAVEFVVDGKLQAAGFYAPEQASMSDRHTVTTVTDRTIFSLAGLVAAPLGPPEG